MTDIADRYERLARAFTDTVDAVPADAWDRPAPCDGWTARDIVRHVVDTEVQFLEPHGLGPDKSTPPAEPEKAWPVVRDSVQEILRDPERADRTFDGWFGPTDVKSTI